MTWKNSYEVGTPVTFYAACEQRPAAVSCKAIMAAGPVDRWAYEMGATTMVLQPAIEGTSVEALLLNITKWQCIVADAPDGFEVATPVRVETDQGTYYGQIMANVKEGPDTFDRAVLEERGFQVLADDNELTEANGCECGNPFTLCHPDA